MPRKSRLTQKEILEIRALIARGLSLAQTLNGLENWSRISNSFRFLVFV